MLFSKFWFERFKYNDLWLFKWAYFRSDLFNTFSFCYVCKTATEKGRHNRVVYFALFFQTGCNEQVTQSSVGTKHGYNPKSVDSKCKKLKQRWSRKYLRKLATLPRRCKHSPVADSKLPQRKSSLYKRMIKLKFPRFLADRYRKCCALLIKEMLFSKFWFERFDNSEEWMCLQK